MKSFSAVGEKQLKTLDDDRVFGRVDSLAVNKNQIMMMWLSEKQKTQINLQQVNLENLTPEPTLTIPIQQGISGFPSISEFQNRIYITYESLQNELKLLELSLSLFN